MIVECVDKTSKHKHILAFNKSTIVAFKASYYHADGLGSIVAMTDDQARNVQQYEYDSFGNQHDMKNRIKQPYGYTGREHDRETGLRYYRARYYDGEVGVFLSKDPLGFGGGDTGIQVNFRGP